MLPHDALLLSAACRLLLPALKTLKHGVFDNCLSRWPVLCSVSERTCRFEFREAFLGFLGFFSRFVGVVMEWNYGILGLGVEIGLLCVINESCCLGQL
jgi:hypothetical protein